MIELLTSAEMAQADRLAIAGGVAGIDLMERAGQAVAARAAGLVPSSVPIVVVAGTGNNGGDGFVAARVLAGQGYRVRVLLVGERAGLTGDAGQAARTWTGPTEAADPAALAQAGLQAGLIVDALFGAGLNRPVEGLPRVLIETMNASPAPVLAVDLPSGIDGTTGAAMGAAVRAAETMAFFRRKIGHILLPGRQHCGSVQVADIGIPDHVLATIAPRTFVNAPDLWGDAFPVPRLDGHKYARGHAVVVSGGMASTGAARLAARGALRAGAGLVTVASPASALAINAAANLAVMVRPVDGADELAAFLVDRRLNALVLGPGGGVGPEMRDTVLAALAGHRAIVLDADALTSFAAAPAALAAAIKARGQANCVLTPHDGEFSSLVSALPESRNPLSKLEKARLAAREFGAILVLKGPDTVVAAPDGRAAIAENAPPWLASAGSGDVLAGFVAGLLAQGAPAFEAAAAAVWLHGEAGIQAGPGLIAEDLPEAVPSIYRRLFIRLGARL